MQRKRQNAPKLWTITKSVNICVMGIPETTKKERTQNKKYVK